MPCGRVRALCASDGCAFVTLDGACCRMHYYALLYGSWDPHFWIQRTILG